ncbi:hypothetical protein [Sorangium sp. So ce128]|uniref:hypothetical protein n=1 Tax=Sorangium sp. So ce128 TaxID=3133281 RepID=UPI003F6097CC
MPCQRCKPATSRESLARALDLTLQCCELALQLADLSTFVQLEAEHHDSKSRSADLPERTARRRDSASDLPAWCRGVMEIVGAATRGLIEVAQDRFSLAEGHLAHARRLAEERADVVCSGVLAEPLDGLLELTRARGAHSSGQEIDARAHHQGAQQRFARLAQLREGKGSPAARPTRSDVEAEDTGTTPRTSGCAPAASAAERTADLELGPDGMWFRAHGGARVSMRRRHAMRRLLLRLVEQLDTAPGQPVAMSTLIEVGWPDERILVGAAMNRLYNTIAVLRSLGLGEMLHTAERGYVLEPSLSVSFHPREA